MGGASPPRRRSYWPGRARWEGRFEKKQPAPRGTPRADWLSRGLAPASERATGTGWGQSAAAAALTAGTGRLSFQFPFPLRWIPPRALPTAAASCFSRRRPPPRPPWLRRSFRMSSRLSPISASPWSSWGAGESGRGALRALGAGTPLFLASVVIPPKKARFGGLTPAVSSRTKGALFLLSPAPIRALQGTLSPLQGVCPPSRAFCFPLPDPKRGLGRLPHL